MEFKEILNRLSNGSLSDNFLEGLPPENVESILSYNDPKTGDYLLHSAVKNFHKNPRILPYILTKCSNDQINIQNRINGQTPLFYAMGLDFGVVPTQHLVLSGADINITDKKGNSPLMFLFKINETQHTTPIAQFLIQHGANINHRKGSCLGSTHTTRRIVSTTLKGMAVQSSGTFVIEESNFSSVQPAFRRDISLNFHIPPNPAPSPSDSPSSSPRNVINVHEISPRTNPISQLAFSESKETPNLNKNNTQTEDEKKIKEVLENNLNFKQKRNCVLQNSLNDSPEEEEKEKNENINRSYLFRAETSPASLKSPIQIKTFKKNQKETEKSKKESWGKKAMGLFHKKEKENNFLIPQSFEEKDKLMEEFIWVREGLIKNWILYYYVLTDTIFYCFVNQQGKLTKQYPISGESYASEDTKHGTYRFYFHFGVNKSLHLQALTKSSKKLWIECFNKAASKVELTKLKKSSSAIENPISNSQTSLNSQNPVNNSSPINSSINNSLINLNNPPLKNLQINPQNNDNSFLYTESNEDINSIYSSDESFDHFTEGLCSRVPKVSTSIRMTLEDSQHE